MAAVAQAGASRPRSGMSGWDAGTTAAVGFVFSLFIFFGRADLKGFPAIPYWAWRWRRLSGLRTAQLLFGPLAIIAFVVPGRTRGPHPHLLFWAALATGELPFTGLWTQSNKIRIHACVLCSRFCLH